MLIGAFGSEAARSLSEMLTNRIIHLELWQLSDVCGELLHFAFEIRIFVAGLFLQDKVFQHQQTEQQLRVSTLKDAAIDELGCFRVARVIQSQCYSKLNLHIIVG